MFIDEPQPKKRMFRGKNSQSVCVLMKLTDMTGQVHAVAVESVDEDEIAREMRLYAHEQGFEIASGEIYDFFSHIDKAMDEIALLKGMR